MGQDECLKLLEKNKNKWLSTKEIRELLKTNSVHNSLSRLYKYGEVSRRKKSEQYNCYEWKIKK